MLTNVYKADHFFTLTHLVYTMSQQINFPKGDISPVDPNKYNKTVKLKTFS